MSVTASEFRAGMRQLAAAVNVITTAQGSTRAGMTATAVVSLTAEPPQLGIAINRGNTSFAAIDASGIFAINVLSHEQAGLASRFSGADGIRGEERFATGSWTTLATGAPILADSAASFDCRVVNKVELSSHVLFIGEVQAVRSTPTVTPLLFMDGTWASLLRASEQDFQAYEAVVDEIDAAMTAVLITDKHPKDQLQAFCRDFTAISARSIHVLRAFFSRETIVPASRLDEINRRKRAVEAKLRDLLARGISTGDFDVPDAALAADAIIGMMNSIHRWPTGQDGAQGETLGAQFGALISSMVAPRSTAYLATEQGPCTADRPC